MRKFKDLSEMEQSVIQEALIEYKGRLRTVYSGPNDAVGKVLGEDAFLAGDISDGRRRRYAAAVDLLAEVRDHTFRRRV